MRLTWKRIAALLLGVVLCALLGPAVLAADEEEPAALEFAVSDWDGPSNDEMFTEYVRGMFYGPSRPMVKSPGSLAQTLGPVKYAIEQRFKAMIEEVAAGQRTNTQLEVCPSDLTLPDADFSALTTDDMDTIYYALLSDCSASLYWHDVRLGRARGVGSDYAVIYFKVAADYQGSEYEVDPSRITAANTALSNVQEILDAYRADSDVDKLRGYMYEICLRNVYNDAAAAGSVDPSVGINPWQLVYVFDNDPDTNVVCEGYSKAFEYLCNNTAFSSGLINCYCVSGYARVTDGVPDPNSGHMWNIVRMDDGDNYVVDVTWSDSESGSVTDYGMLLSYAKEGSLEAGYRLSRGSGSASVRQYKSSMSLYYTDEELTICDHAYGSHTHTAAAPVQENVIAPTCTAAGSCDLVTYCSRCGHEMSRETGVVLPATGHTAGQAAEENIVAPTCTEPGCYDNVVRCTVCQGIISSEHVDVDPLGHSPGQAAHEGETLPTCTEPGCYDNVVRCTVCQGIISSEHIDVDPLGHDYVYDPDGWSWTDYTAATATFVCSHDASHKEIVAATITSERTEPSVGVAGKVVYTATVDYKGNSYTDTRTEILPALPAPTVTAPQITSQPAAVKAVVNKTAAFTVSAQGTGLTYQWYVQTKGSAAWTPVGGATSAKLTVTATAALDGARYRCVVTGEGGKAATSNEVTLTVVTAPKITAQPKKASVKAGKKVTFKVKASGYDLTYQWYYQKPGAKKWVKIKNAVKPSYSFKAARSKNGYKYRCYVTNPAGTVKSKTAKLTVK